MSGRRTGFVAALDGKTLKDEPLAYSSERSHLLVDTSPAKKHLDIKEMNGGPLISINQIAGTVKRETFFKIDHHLPFIPRVSVRFYTRQVPAELSGTEGLYSSFLFYGGVPCYESILFRVDKDSVYFIHEVGCLIDGIQPTYNSIMQDILFRIKYTIFQNEGMDEPYESTYQVV